MNDQFLTHLRRDPGQKLARAVYDDIKRFPGHDPVPDAAGRSAAFRSGSRSRRRRVVAFAALGVVVLFIISTLTSPAVRAIVEDIVRHIGGLTIRETAIYPLTDGYVTGPDRNQYLTLEEARKVADFDIRLPEALPDRYVLVDEIIASPGGGHVDIRWKGDETRGDGLWLRISNASPDVAYLVGSDSTETIEINGQDALFIRGGWLENTKSWDPDISRDVRWVHDGLTYHLSTGGQYGCPDEAEFRCPLSDEDLIRIAESIK